MDALPASKCYMPIESPVPGINPDGCEEASPGVNYIHICQNSPDRGQSRKIRFCKISGVPNWRKRSELCYVFPVFLRKNRQNPPKNPGLVSQLSATPRDQLHWTGPSANCSEYVSKAIYIYIYIYIFFLNINLITSMFRVHVKRFWIGFRRCNSVPCSMVLILLGQGCKFIFEFRLRISFNSGKSHPWTNASVGGNFWKLSGPLVHTNFPRKRYGPMALKVLWKFRSWPVLVHRVLFPVITSTSWVHLIRFWLQYVITSWKWYTLW